MNQLHPIGTLCRCYALAYANVSHRLERPTIGMDEIVRVIEHREYNEDHFDLIFSTLDGERVGLTTDYGFLIPLSPLEQLALEAG